LIGSVPCSQLTAADVRSVALHVETTSRGYGPGARRKHVDPATLLDEARRKRRVTANHALHMLKKALKSAFDEGKITNDHAWRSVRGFPHVEKNRVEYLSLTQAKRMVDAARHDLRRLILAALYTGCRVTELFRIPAGDLLDARMALYVHPMKTYRGLTIALPDEGYHFFKSLARGKSRREPLLVRRDGSPWSSNYVSAIFRPFVRSLGHSDDFVFYSLRHTYASLLLQAGTPPIVVALQLGHLNMQTVIRTYAHVVDDFFDIEFRQSFRPGFLTEPDLFSNSLVGDDKL